MVLLIWWMMWHCRQCIMHCTFMMQAMVVDQCLAYTGLWAEQQHAQHDKQAAQVLSLLMIMSRLTDQSDWWFITGGASAVSQQYVHCYQQVRSQRLQPRSLYKTE